MTLNLTKPTVGSTSWGPSVNQNFTDIENAVDAGVVPATAGGRLTAQSGVPVPSSDVLISTTIYYYPYVGEKIALYDGTNWNYLAIGTSLSKSLSGLAANTNHDVFLYDDNGTIKFEFVAWTNNTTRATALARVDGVWTKSGANTRRYVGTIRTTSAGQVADSQAKRFVFNAQNRVPRRSFNKDSTSSWTYASTSFAAMNSGNAAWKTEFVVGLDEEAIKADVHVYSIPPGSGYVVVSIGLDSTTADATRATEDYRPWQGMHLSSFTELVGIGYHYVNGIHRVSGGTATFYGELTVDVIKSAMLVECWA